MDKLYGKNAKATSSRKPDPKVYEGEIGVLVQVDQDGLYCLQVFPEENEEQALKFAEYVEASQSGIVEVQLEDARRKLGQDRECWAEELLEHQEGARVLSEQTEEKGAHLADLTKRLREEERRGQEFEERAEQALGLVAQLEEQVAGMFLTYVYT